MKWEAKRLRTLGGKRPDETKQLLLRRAFGLQSQRRKSLKQELITIYYPCVFFFFSWEVKIILGSALVNRISNPQRRIRHWLFLEVERSNKVF